MYVTFGEVKKQNKLGIKILHFVNLKKKATKTNI